MTKKPYNISAGFPYRCAIKIARAQVGVTPETYTDITDPSLIPSEGWALCFVDAANQSHLALPLDWSQMDAQGYLPLELTAAQTLQLAGRRLHLEVRNAAGTSDLMDCPDALFYFVPNNLHE